MFEEKKMDTLKQSDTDHIPHWRPCRHILMRISDPQHRRLLTMHSAVIAGFSKLVLFFVA